MAALRWQFIDNPPSKTLVDVAITEWPPRIAAIYATLPVYVRVDGKVRLALQSLDTLTDAEFRGKGLFVSLARSTFARAAADGATFIYGFPNGNSGPGFFNKFEWQRLDPVPFLVRPLRSRYILDRLGISRRAPWLPDVPLSRATKPTLERGLRLESVQRFDARFTELWSRFADGIGVAVERDAAYLNWRLVDKPEESYQRLAVFEGDTPIAFVAFALKEKHGGRVGYIMELLFLRGREREGRRLLRTALAELTSGGADVALAWSLGHSPGYVSFLRSGFVPLPVRLRPIELHFGARAFDRSFAALVEQRSSWYLSYLDSDTV